MASPVPKSFLTDEAKQALTDSIKTIESSCSAEIVVAVRARSGTYLHVPFVIGAVSAFIALAYMLFGDPHFSLPSILIDPFLVGIVLGVAAHFIHPLKRLMTSTKGIDRRIDLAAKATFFEKGVRHTSQRTGILVYISLTERRAALIMDSGVEKEVNLREWAQVEQAVKASVARGDDGAAVAKELTKLCDVLAPVLERGEDDENELPDEICG